MQIAEYVYFEVECIKNEITGDYDLDKDALNFWLSRNKGLLLLCSLNPVGVTSFAVFMRTKGENSWEYFKDHLDELEGYLHSVHPDLKDKLRVDVEFMKES